MPKTKLISSILASTVVISSFFILSGDNAQARRRQIPLLEAKCVSSGLGNAREQEQNVSIGRAVYTSKFYIGSGTNSASMTCNIKPDKSPEPVFKIFNLGFGMRDNSTNSPPVQVRVFLDGQLAEATTIAPMQQKTGAFDVSNVSNVSIEATCTSRGQYCDRVYFFTANLEPKVPVQPKPPEPKPSEIQPQVEPKPPESQPKQ
ncbi:MAG: hypothetical protein KME64_19250 [Scytonematopsis contorta HA4267-MV1]|jgi:hypothetical protein|nr:hypothetical protein [Scytonematopsis contorta HA4267-MV1]